jgi:hypothetical protein
LVKRFGKSPKYPLDRKLRGPRTDTGMGKKVVGSTASNDLGKKLVGPRTGTDTEIMTEISTTAENGISILRSPSQ